MAIRKITSGGDPEPKKKKFTTKLTSDVSGSHTSSSASVESSAKAESVPPKKEAPKKSTPKPTGSPRPPIKRPGSSSVAGKTKVTASIRKMDYKVPGVEHSLPDDFEDYKLPQDTPTRRPPGEDKPGGGSGEDGYKRTAGEIRNQYGRGKFGKASADPVPWVDGQGGGKKGKKEGSSYSSNKAAKKFKYAQRVRSNVAPKGKGFKRSGTGYGN
jgi:hypothetical protein